MKVHAIEKFPCSNCGKKFSKNSFLNQHKKYCDLDLNCSCGSHFTSIESLMTHVRRTQHISESLDLYFERYISCKEVICYFRILFFLLYKSNDYNLMIFQSNSE